MIQDKYVTLTSVPRELATGVADEDNLIDLRRGAASPGPVVVMADIQYGDQQLVNNALSRDLRWSYYGDFTPVGPLVNSLQEAEAALRELPQSLAENAVRYYRNDASESAFRELRSPEILLISTHGAYRPEPMSVAVAGEDYWTATSPLARCALLLANANHAPLAETAVDGVLTGLEIVRTDLSHTRLVVLSACESNLGDLRYGDGLMGLRRAFHLAGAKSVMGTQWVVSDQKSAALVAAFFQADLDQLPAHKALAVAQRKLLESFDSDHPYYWAAFSITGPLN